MVRALGGRNVTTKWLLWKSSKRHIKGFLSCSVTTFGHKGVFSYIFLNSFPCFYLNGNSMLQMLKKVELLMIR